MDAQPYPARLDGQLDPAVSRWLWLIKWLPARAAAGRHRQLVMTSRLPAPMTRRCAA
jgi:hypothetical protein